MNGRKRHILVDAMGLLIRVVVHAADIQDRDGAKRVLALAERDRLVALEGCELPDDRVPPGGR